ncbi:MAG TPA: thioredoxin family protein [Gaiellaceae bacterium]|nr:thioredoxin family protein [Gaiellaceae bacterium]
MVPPCAGKKAFALAEDSRPLLVFFGASHSGPARRMESLVAHLARKERERLRVTTIDVDERPELAQRFHVDTVPTLALVKGKRVVERLEGRASAPKIERMLAPHLVA